MIDSKGFRSGTAIIIVNAKQQVLWAKRIGQDAWQFPQGGLNEGETPREGMFRELYEEVGLQPDDVQILAESKRWLYYRLPKRLVRRHSKPLCIGQKQKWFLLRLVSSTDNINFKTTDTPEFDDWKWVDYWHPLQGVIKFKRKVYQCALKEFAHINQQNGRRNRLFGRRKQTPDGAA